jgi:hypothetical protein
VVERRYIGGSCPNIACLPSKNIIYSAKVISLLRRGMEFGVESTEWAVDMTALRVRKRVMVAGRLEMHLANYQASGAKLVTGHGRFIGPRTIEVKLNESGTPIGFDFEWTWLGLLDRPGHVNLNYRTENLSERRMRLNVSDGTGTHRMNMGNVRVVGPRIDAVEAKALADGGKAIILDVVASHVWPAMARTIQGSIRIPPEEIKTRFGELPRDKAIIAYCT